MERVFNPPVAINTAPYPKVDETTPDPETVALLKQDYAGSVSELTAIMQYLYQHSRSANETFSNAMREIALFEMEHLDMLGSAIQALGGKPSFDDGRYYWQAGKVNYADDYPAMLQANIDAESAAIANYQQHAAQTTNPQVRALLDRIIQDEQLHLKFFQESLAQSRQTQ